MQYSAHNTVSKNAQQPVAKNNHPRIACCNHRGRRLSPVRAMQSGPQRSPHCPTACCRITMILPPDFANNSTCSTPPGIRHLSHGDAQTLTKGFTKLTCCHRSRGMLKSDRPNDTMLLDSTYSHWLAEAVTASFASSISRILRTLHICFGHSCFAFPCIAL